MLAANCSEGGYVLPSFENPLQRVRYISTGQTETHRSAMPIHYIRMLKDLIRVPYKVSGTPGDELTAQLLKLNYTRDEAGDLTGEMLTDGLKSRLEEAGVTIDSGFRWPRTQRDTFAFTAPGSSGPVEIWSPVRAYALLLKLELPLRTFQVRVLDSGESAPDTYEPGRGLVPQYASVGCRDQRRRKEAATHRSDPFFQGTAGR